jgi:hypothetical protein
MLRDLAARAAARFDLGAGQGAAGGIDWNAGTGNGWESGYAPQTGKAAGNFSDYLVKLLKGG